MRNFHNIACMHESFMMDYIQGYTCMIALGCSQFANEFSVFSPHDN